MDLKLLLLLLLFFLLTTTTTSSMGEKQTYIVHVANSRMPPEFAESSHWFAASLQSVSDTAELLYSYSIVAHGFSARLTPTEADALRRSHGVVSVEPETRYELHTTRTPEFLGLSRQLGGVSPHLSGALASTDVVVGVLDTGGWPESRSYDDTGFGPVPPTWKGECEEGKGFPKSSCNRKLVGARSFSRGYEAAMGPIDESRENRSPRDDDGHGTHTSTTAAGSAVPDASLFGFAAGTARGMATRARVAVYKVCWVGGCFSSDILAAIDRAVDDGVDVLSLSLGGGQSDYFKDHVAVGSFAAMEKGVFVSCSAGNGGPGSSTLSNVAPWITTVGAGTLDRDFPAYVVLGNGKNYSGVSLYSGKPLSNSPKLPFIYAGNATNSSTGNLCLTGTLIPEKVAGKIVFCDRGVSARVKKGYVVKEAGGAGMVLANTAANGEELVADSHLLPGAAVGQTNGDAIRSYLLSNPNATATIVFDGTKLGVKPSPVVAAFSSRGPNGITPGILKPDMVAPGVNILAGWSRALGPTGLSVDKRRTDFNIISGTSMSCPHVSGLAALLKAAHPGWSPAAIKSALMTTAYNTYHGGEGILDVSTRKPATPFELGAGHVDPVRALDPGLVYDLGTEDYLGFLCALNYTTLQIAAISKRNYTCREHRGKRVRTLEEFNYPSFAVAADGGSPARAVHRRVLTNVGTPGTYRATVVGVGADVNVTVSPSELSFKKDGEKKGFELSVAAEKHPAKTVRFARLQWSDGKHVVGSPIAIRWT